MKYLFLLFIFLFSCTLENTNTKEVVEEIAPIVYEYISEINEISEQDLFHCCCDKEIKDLVPLLSVKVSFINIEGKTEMGELIVHQEIAEEVIDIFRDIYECRFPIVKMIPIDFYECNDDKSMEDNTISPMYRKKNYTMEVYVNIDSSNDTLYNIDLNKDSQNFKNYSIVNKGIPLLNDGNVFINQYESTEIKICDLTYYNYPLNITDIMNMVRSGNMCSQSEVKKISKPSTVSSPSDSYFI